MALKPTIYKLQVALADSDRNYYQDHTLVISRHPSETLERMSARVLAYCLQASASLEFTRGLSSTEEPDIWQHSDSGEIEHWIEVGQPEEPRLRKATGKAAKVTVYAFGKSTDTWWKLQGEAIGVLPGTSVWKFDWDDIAQLAALMGRNTRLGVNIVGGTIYIDNGEQSTSLEPQQLCGPD